MSDHKIDILRVQLKATYIGLFLNVLLPITLIVVIYLLVERGIVASGGFSFFDRPHLKIIFFILIAVSLIDYVVIYIFRKRYLESASPAVTGSPKDSFEKSAIRLAWITCILNMIPIGYGVAMILLGSPYEAAMLFIALTLVGYQIFRPRRKYLEQLYEKFEGKGTRTP